ncbi:thioester domain-containing protein [Actinokineospora enzanensis]|uniref:thioester domain-containing protein n=1 Tax=Actinokineospora enzanensis TaxID=155975 RepID=UPI000366C3E1|nr:thioester domain-containing protein [Actinokineospora enzanensis]
MASRWNLARAGAAVAVASVAATIAALPASAADTTPVKGTLVGGTPKEDTGPVLALTRGDHAWAPTPYLLTLKLADGTALKVYCVGADINATFKNTYTEGDWDKYPVDGSPFHKNSSKINWVLQHGFPTTSLEAINEAVKKADPKYVSTDDGIERDEAIAATQAALWHFSDNYNLDEAHPTKRENHADSDADIVALYDYLIGEGTNTGVGEPKAPQLAISPSSLSGAVGDLIGPFTVTTNGTITKLEGQLPQGVTFVDADGKPLTVKNIEKGGKVYLKVAKGTAKGSTSFTVSASAPPVEIGRLFTAKGDDGKPAQPLIVAGTQPVDVSAKAAANWDVTPPSTTTAPPTTTTTVPPTTTVAPTTAPTTTVVPVAQASNNLPNTGASILTPVLIAVGLLAAGGGALLYVRYRRRSA